MKTVLHVNQHLIKHNRKTGDNKPCLTVKDYKQNRKAHEAILVDAEGNEMARVVYRPSAPLKCGAVCWVQTELEVETI